jgi:hypothetical protein
MDELTMKVLIGAIFALLGGVFGWALGYQTGKKERS